jgi:pimeloyl-ACP methyl ester carboxylesterase
VNCDGMQRHRSKNIWTWVLAKMGQLKLTPRVLIGHSFGGKVALSMVDQAAKPLARPVRVQTFTICLSFFSASWSSVPWI